MSDGILSGDIDLDGPRHRRPSYPVVPAELGTVLEHRASGTVGAVLSYKPQQVVLRDRHGRDHSIVPRAGGFLLDGQPVSLRAPDRDPVSAARGVTASGSVDAGPTPARIARPSRIWVEGLHDAELVEKVWGDDLRIEGVVVEHMDGMDDLVDRVARFGPRPGRRLGVLLDHLVDGTRESRTAAQIHHADVLILGHPYVDVWQAVKPGLLGLTVWPDVPLGQDWKHGIMQRVGFRGPSGAFWKDLLSRVESYRDLEQPMLHAVESLIDFVTGGE